MVLLSKQYICSWCDGTGHRIHGFGSCVWCGGNGFEMKESEERSTISELQEEIHYINQVLTRAMGRYMDEVETSQALEEENIKLRAEIEALKLKPVTTSMWYNIYPKFVTGDVESRKASDDTASKIRIGVLRIDCTDGIYSCHIEDV